MPRSCESAGSPFPGRTRDCALGPCVRAYTISGGDLGMLEPTLCTAHVRYPLHCTCAVRCGSVRSVANAVRFGLCTTCCEVQRACKRVLSRRSRKAPMGFGNLAQHSHCQCLPGRRQGEFAGARVCRRPLSSRQPVRHTTQAIAEAEQLEAAFRSDPVFTRVRGA